MHHDGAVMLLCQPFHELVSEATQSVFIGDHNFVAIPRVDSFQKGRKALALPVEAGPNVGDDGVCRVSGLECCDLAIKVWLLVSGRDSGINELCLWLLGDVEAFVDAGFGVEALAAGQADGVEDAQLLPVLKGGI